MVEAGKKTQGYGNGPQRTCIGCRKVRPKAELLRFVVLEGALTPDRDGIKQGRGAYLCMDAACLNAALKRKDVFSRALRARVGLPDAATLLEAIKGYKR